METQPKEEIQATKHSLHELLVYGFIRQLHSSTTPSSDILSLCHRFYLSRKWIFADDNTYFHMLDATTPKLYSKVIKFEKRQRHPQRTFCFIPHLTAEQVQKCFPAADINPRHSYIGVMTQKPGNPGKAATSFYAFRSIDGVPKSRRLDRS